MTKKARFLPGNRVELLRNGADYFPALEAAIDGATREIHLQTYIFQADATGARIAEALKRAAQRGVAARLLFDGFGSRGLPRGVIEDMLAAGVEVLVYRPEAYRLPLRRQRLRRMHRKLAVIDARVAFLGGINIIDDYDTPGHTPPRFDYAVRVEGPLLAHIYPVAKRLWSQVAWVHFRRRWVPTHESIPVTQRCGTQKAAFVIRDNLRHRRDIEKAYLRAIARAREEIIIANAYFLPGVRFRHALLKAAARGVRVVLLLQGRVEYLMLHYASRALYGLLLEGGVEIYEYYKSFMHAKVAVIDQHWATVGSSNIDPFSLFLAKEANVVVQERGFARELRTSLQAAIAQGARRVSSRDWKRRPWFYRTADWAAYGLMRFAMGMLGFGENQARSP